MSNQLMLNDQVYHIGESGLPALIVYGEGQGGSHYSVSMAADLFLSGSKILFLTAYPMAKDDFLSQIMGNEDKTTCVTDIDQLSEASQVNVLESGNEKLFLESVHKLKDINDRVVFVKNMEVFSDLVIDYCLTLEKVILSGNLDECVGRENILSKRFKTTVVFGQPDTKFPFQIPQLEKYSGYLVGENQRGITTIKM